MMGPASEKPYVVVRSLSREPEMNSLYGIATHVLVLVIHIGLTLEGVGTALGDSVQGSTDEACLTHVKRRDHHLQLLNGLHGNGVAAAGECAAQAEVVVEVGTVNGEVGSTTIASLEGHAVSAVG